MKNFIHENYFLENSLAEELYHSCAKDLPIIDFHNHLNPKDLAVNRIFDNLADAWVLSDPYKHRAMRICGVAEDGITGNASDEKKFLNWAMTLPKTLGNPLYLWSALELKRIFGIDQLLTEKNSQDLWIQCNQQLQQDGIGTIDILKKYNTEIICTSDDLLDDLSFHKQATIEHGIIVLPTLRGDTIMPGNDISFKKWFRRLQDQSGTNIKNLTEYKTQIVEQIKRFAAFGCKLADHSLENGFNFNLPTELLASQIFGKLLNGEQSSTDELFQLKSYLLLFLGQEYAKQGWSLQLHIGAHRFTSSRLLHLVGIYGGYAAIGNTVNVAGLCTFLDEMEKGGSLPKIVLYNMNPSDNHVLGSLTGSFTEDGVAGKIQFGPAWWYNDHYEGIRQQLINLSSYGLLSQFIGMTTDSRSVFSFSRHEYFRRILCNFLAEWVKKGNLPNDKDLLSDLIKDVCYYNCKNILFNKSVH